METYRLRLQLRAAAGTPWHADTLFGHLCWVLRYQDGAEAVEDFLELYKIGEPPFVLSDGFPSDPEHGALLPRPLQPPQSSTAPEPASLAAQREAGRRHKAAGDIRWLSLDEFQRTIQGQALIPVTKTVEGARATLKNQINRATATTGGPSENGVVTLVATPIGAEPGAAAATGQLFEFEETFWPEVTVYVRVADGCLELAQRLFEGFAEGGYGKRKSIGYGEMAPLPAAAWEPFAGFAAPAGANGFVVLSHFVPAQDDPTDGWWRLAMKYGRLGEMAGAEVPPFKRPLVQLTPGAVFRLAPHQPARPWYGRIVEGIHGDRPEVVQYGLAFAVPCVLPAALGVPL